MGLEITGKLVKVMPEVSGESKNGPWRKQEFVLETSADRYPKKVCISVWGDTINSLANYGEGDELKVGIDVESREYQSKWYTDIKAWKIESSTGGSTAPSEARPQNTQTAPKNTQMAQEPFPESMSSSQNDDLPF